MRGEEREGGRGEEGGGGERVREGGGGRRLHHFCSELFMHEGSRIHLHSYYMVWLLW